MDAEQNEDVSLKNKDVKNETEEDEPCGHTCGVCGRSFPLLSSLSQHMRRHTREKPYKCPYCEHRTAQKGSLKAHIRSHKLGLLSQGLGGKDGVAEPGQKDNTKILDGPSELVDGTSDKGHKVNGKMKKKGSKKKAKIKDVETAEEVPPSPSVDNISEKVDEGVKAGSFPCGLCSQVFPRALLLKAHMKKHRGSQDHGCRICGRRFRQAWFLQSHMRIHRAKAQLRGGNANEPPATINGVPQDPVSLTNDECLYELCAGCGNFFHDRKTLRIHERVHKQNHGRTQSQPQQDLGDSGLDIDKKQFLESLNLKRAGAGEPLEEGSLGKRIPELDPVCSYQAWQLVTRGQLVEVKEKCLGWEERLADAEVAYDRDKGEYVPLKQEKKRKQLDTSSSNIKKKKVGGSHDHTSNNSAIANGGGGGAVSHQSGRILLNGLGHALYGAMQKKTVKEVYHSTKQTNSIRNQTQEDKKTYVCEHCDFHAVDASSLRSHMHRQHKDFAAASGKQSAVLDNLSQSGSKASGYMDYLRLRSTLLSQPYWSPYTCPPGQERLASSIKTEKTQVAEVKGQGDVSVDAANLLNLSALPEAPGEGTAGDLGTTEDSLVRHQCPYCSHTTHYPEVLWIHQRVAHRVDGSSSMAPKWAPYSNFKGSRTGGGQWRRTGPPPFLEGKDCPALPTPRTQRTHPPGVAANNNNNNNSSSSSSSSNSSSKRSARKTHPGVPPHKSKPAGQSKESQSTDRSVDRSTDKSTSSGRTALLPQKKKSGERSHASEGDSKGAYVQVTSSTSGVSGRSTSAIQSTSSAKQRGHRVAVEENLLPQEGLGFMLARNHARTVSHATADRTHHHHHHPHSQSRDSSSGPKGHDLWSPVNMFGVHGGGAYLHPALFAQGKSESTGERPMDMDILSVLKNYNPHELAALYQHWGFVDPRLDPQALLQFNGHYGSEVHSSSEASKQVSSRSTSSSGSLHKGT